MISLFPSGIEFVLVPVFSFECTLIGEGAGL
jgi:hypothetical protein